MYVGEKRKRRDDIVLLFTAYPMNGNQEKSLGLAYSVEKKSEKEGRRESTVSLFVCHLLRHAAVQFSANIRYESSPFASPVWLLFYFSPRLGTRAIYWGVCGDLRGEVCQLSNLASPDQ